MINACCDQSHGIALLTTAKPANADGAQPTLTVSNEVIFCSVNYANTAKYGHPTLKTGIPILR